MIDFFVISTIVLLLIISLWLFGSLKKENAGLDVNSSLSPDVSVESSLKPSIKTSQKLIRKIQKLTSKLSIGTAKHLYNPPSISLEPYASGCDGGDDDSWITSFPRVVRYNGFGRFPQKVYQGDSSTITLRLNPSIRNPSNIDKPIKVYKQGDKLNVTLTVSRKAKEYLEVELMGAGFTVDGEKKQRQLLISDTLYYQWNCLFEKSGSHSFSLVLRVVDTTDNAVQIGCIEQVIKVAQIDHLTQRQVWVLASSAGVISGILTLAEILKNLGIW